MGLRDPYPPDLLSQPSKVQSMIRFQNTTDRCVDLIWISFEGDRFKYKVIQ